MSTARYRGRFAPSPTGALHFGTLIAAVGSCLRARSQHGDWLLRIEDVDTLRARPGAAQECMRTLEQFGFTWDGEVVYQSQRTEYYQQALSELITREQVYPCSCSRKHLREAADEENDISIYPGHCRKNRFPYLEEHSIRLRCSDATIQVNDKIMGVLQQNLKTECGDFIIKRRDGLFAYQLAVVVDDALQGITEVVRGSDLLDSTPRQIYIQQCLGYAHPDYLHLPLALTHDGSKLSKQTGAKPLAAEHKVQQLVNAIQFLGQQPPDELQHATVDEFWQWAVAHWDTRNIPNTSSVVTNAS